MIEILLLIIGFLLGVWWWSVIILPLFYGIPKSIYYIWKGLLKRTAANFYLKVLILWTIIFFVIAFALVRYFPNVSNILFESGGFAIGQLIGIIVSAWRMLTKDGREDLSADFWDIMFNNNYLDTKNPNFRNIFALTLTKLFIHKFGDRAEKKLNEFLNDLRKK
ncbi:hypothetical protein ISS21_02870 [Patescibacteria group bacterium]|nr:hypothetical protein [Patescibacteria group bacterium]